MNYREFLKQAAHKEITPIKLESGITQGFVKTDSPEKKQTLPLRSHYGKEYALKYRLQDEEKQEEEDSNHLEEVEGLTSISGTLPNPDEVFGDQLTQIYELYPFNKTDKSSLLIHNYKDEILENIESNSVILIKGQTGCGKSTQVPQMILDNAHEANIHCNIVVTQPRRIATISVAKRVAAERGWGIGTIVGYQISLERKVSADTRLLFCTTGVLLQQLLNDQSLSKYTHIIVDEIHERDMETDFLLIIIKRFLKNHSCRTKIILMSATVDTGKFVEYFTRRIKGFLIEPPVIEMAKNLQTHPVSIFYLGDLENAKLPLKIPDIKYDDPSVSDQMLELAASLVEVFHTIDTFEHQGSFIGSVLIFLPGIREITDMYDLLIKRKQRQRGTRQENKEEWIIRPLHSSVTFEEQISVFLPPPPNHRKIILATNIAESSITVTDIKYVIDVCMIKYLMQEPDCGYNSLQLAWMSKSQGEQRAGRVGRVMPGRVYRLVPKNIYEMFNKDCEPEIQRSPLDIVVLKAKQLASDSPPAKILAFAMDPPDLSNIHRTILTLKLAGALTRYVNGDYFEDDGELTFTGQVMASLPLDINLSKLIIMGHKFSMLKDAVIIACAMTVRSVFSTPFKQQLEAYNSKITWADSSCSDPIAYKFAYDVWRRKKADGFFDRSGGLSQKELAERYFIQIKSLVEVSRLEEEVTRRLNRLNIVEQTNPSTKWNNMEKPIILKIILAGAFYPNYFLRKPLDEKEAVRILGGRNPFNTCYLNGFPLNQPGPLYADAIKNHFTHCGSDINVSFDGSNKVYLEFGNSTTDIESVENPASMPGNIEMALYRAIKLRQFKRVISVPLLDYHEAQERWKQILLDKNKEERGESSLRMKELGNVKPSNLPGTTIEILTVNISHKESPSKFWVQIADDTNQMRLARMFDLLNGNGRSGLIPMKKNLEIGMLVAAPFSENNRGTSSNYFRAKIRGYGPGKSVQVYFIDYGNSVFVSEHTIMDFDTRLVELNIKEDPEIAMECRLSEVQPSAMLNKNGQWSHYATLEFGKYFSDYDDPNAIAQVYSVVKGVVSVILFRNPGMRIKKSFNFQDSFNFHLIKKGFADHCEEPYLSRENHLLREAAKKRPDLAKSFSSESPDCCTYVQSPLESECRDKIILRGPKSPLEMQLYCMTQKCLNKNVNIDWSSVNSILLDTYPMDPHERILVAGQVNVSPSGDSLILRQTTLMPNIHGLFAIIAMIFSPYVELRVDEGRTRWTGALCGLGCDRFTHKSYDPENDMEINFDVAFTYEDLENINRIRYWMNIILYGGVEWEKEFNSNSEIPVAQEKLKELLSTVLLKKRPSQGVMGHGCNFQWGLVDDNLLLCPMEDDEANSYNAFYSLIWAVRLKVPSSRMNDEISQNIDKLQAIGLGLENLRSSITCSLCHITLDDILAVKFHLSSSMHRESLFEFNQRLAEN